METKKVSSFVSFFFSSLIDNKIRNHFVHFLIYFFYSRQFVQTIFFSFYYFISFYIFSQEVLNINKFCEVGVKLKILYVRKYKVNSLLPLKRVQFYLLKHIFIWKRKKKFFMIIFMLF